ncbi:MAG: glycerophosphoryl diester phosphodiesterase membrane domain-containing protein [Sphingomicrobium sp.]
MVKLSISRVWDESRETIARDGGLITTVALALFVLPGTIIGTIEPRLAAGLLPTGGNSVVSYLGPLFFLVIVVGRLAVVRLALGGAVSVGEAIRQGAIRTPVAIAAFIIFLLPFVVLGAPILLRMLEGGANPSPLASAGLLLVLIACFALAMRLVLLVFPIALADRLGPFAILKRSWDLTQGNWWRLIAFVFLFFCASVIASRATAWVVGSALTLTVGAIEPLTIGAMLFALALTVVGAIFAVLFSVMLARIYVQLTGDTAAEASVPTSGS